MMGFGGLQKPMIIGDSGCRLYSQTLHFLFFIYERMKGAAGGFVHFGTVLAIMNK